MAENPSETVLSDMFYTSEDSELDDETTEDEDVDAEEKVDAEEGDESIDDEDDGDEESGTIDYDGREITTDQIEEWELAYNNRKHQQSDYTKKTSAAADQMKVAQAESEKYQEINKSLEDSLSAVNAMLDEEEKLIDWDKLSDDDPGEAQKLERKFKKKRSDIKAATDKVLKAKKQAQQSKIVDESKALRKLMPDWFEKNGRPTKLQRKETGVIADYLDANGYPENYANQISSAKEWKSLSDAAKYHALQKKKPSVTKKVKKVAKSTGSKGKSVSTTLVNLADKFYGT